MGILNNSNAISVDSGYDITDSLRFRSSASASLSRTFSTPTNARKFTWSLWVKVSGTGHLGIQATNGLNATWMMFGASGITLTYSTNTSAVITFNTTSTAVFRDPSSWYHVIVAYDSAQATSTNRVKMYVNGNQVTMGGSFPALNAVITMNSAYEHRINNTPIVAGGDNYLTEINFVDGQALAPTDFGESDDNGTWIPKEYTGTYGTNGFYLPMKPTTQATGFNTVLYTGNNTVRSITNVGFNPDLVWLKSRNATYSNYLFDSVRGATKRLSSDSSSAEDTASGAVTSFNSDGFSLGSGDAGSNNNGTSFVAWCWDAGSSTVSNTNGTINSQVRANPATGFSIVSYTGTGAVATVGHGLASVPEMVICKRRNTAGGGWIIYHSGVASDAETYYMFLNSSAAAVDLNTVWNDTAPSSTVFTLGTNATANLSSEPNVAYCFADVAGYQKISSYTGNGSTTGPIVDVGFEPAFVLIKRTDSARNWVIFDNTRNPVNQRNLSLEPTVYDAEYNNTTAIDFLSNGFQPKSSGPSWNASGGNYIYLAIADTRDAKFNFDASGNKNNWTANNINSSSSGDTTYDLMSDVPTLTDTDTANFAVINPLNSSTTTVPTTSNANLRIVGTANTYQGMYMSMAIPSTGKWYFEYTYETKQGAGGNQQTLITPSPSLSGSGATSDSTTLYGLYSNSNYQYGSTGQTDLGIAAVAGNTQMVAYDSDTGKLWWGYNGTWFLSGNPSAGTSPLATQTASIEKYIANVTYGTGGTTSYNFGQRPFAYTPPTGFKKLNTFNLPDSTITDGSEHFVTALYSGSGGVRSIDNTITDSSGVETGEAIKFSPDFTWIKARNSGSYHVLQDSVRGPTAYLSSNTTAVENSNTSYDWFRSFDSNGFTVSYYTTTGGTTTNEWNHSGYTYAAWNWRGSDSTAVSNTDGDITSTVSANPAAGFSVVTYTGNGTSGSTIGHGLSIAPSMVIVKSRNNAPGYWMVYHSGMTSASYWMALNVSNAQSAATSVWNNTAPTSSVFTVGNDQSVNLSSAWNYVAYCFAEIEGYSKFGSYIGNGSTDGPFVYTGFRPAFLLLKNSNTTNGWGMFDVKRDTYNIVNQYLEPNASNAEAAYINWQFDFLSNGFKLRSYPAETNGSGNTIIYMAFAENPFKNSNAR